MFTAIPTSFLEFFLHIKGFVVGFLVISLNFQERIACFNDFNWVWQFSYFLFIYFNVYVAFEFLSLPPF